MAEYDQAARNLAWADALAEGLAAGGVSHAIISPGSRSTPLTLALVRAPAVRVEALPDERCAAFRALGIARATGRPAVVVATSGSAGAHWYPAVLEAEADGIPLICITADRPPELQATGANQVTNQTALFGEHVREFVSLPPPDSLADDTLALTVGLRAAERSLWPAPGPIHINAAFREPLVATHSLPEPPARPAAAANRQRPSITPDPVAIDALAALVAGRPGLIICGRGVRDSRFPDAVAHLARTLDAPLLADPLSGLRWGGHDRGRVLCAYDLSLRSPETAKRPGPAWVLQFGAAPVSAAVSRYLDLHDAELVTVAEGGAWQDPGRRSRRRILGDPTAVAQSLGALKPEPGPGEWWSVWEAAEAAATGLCNTPALRPPEADVVAALESVLPDGAPLFIGNSLPIRMLDIFSRGRAAAIAIYGNRGLSGIDGNVSTALGIAAGAGRRVTALIGDLTLYHDMNGLLAARDTPASFVVLDNGGGGIFDLLPQSRLSSFENYWLTPTGLDLRRVAQLYGLDYAKIPASDLGAALQRADSGSAIIHVPVERELSTQRLSALWRAAGEPGSQI